MKQPPEGWPRISSAVFYEDAGKAIDWLCRAFGFEVRLKVEGEGGRIEHSELALADGLIMVSSTGETSKRPRAWCKSPRSLNGAALADPTRRGVIELLRNKPLRPSGIVYPTSSHVSKRIFHGPRPST